MRGEVTKDELHYFVGDLSDPEEQDWVSLFESLIYRCDEGLIVTREKMQVFLEGQNALARLIVDVPADPTFRVTVDYSLTSQEMIAAGHYDEVDDRIDEWNFSIFGEGKVERELVLVRLNRTVNLLEAMAELDRRGLMPAKPGDLLALGAEFPDLQREFPIVLFNSLWLEEGFIRLFPRLWEYEGQRKLGWCYVDEQFEGCGFLAVRARKVFGHQAVDPRV
jgi:hypothetical protein